MKKDESTVYDQETGFAGSPSVEFPGNGPSVSESGTEESGEDNGSSVDYDDVERPRNWLERFLDGRIGKGKFSWGLLVLFLFALYAIIEFIVSIMFFFGKS